MLRFIATVLFCLSFGTHGEAQQPADFPSRLVRIIVPSAPGGGTDILARVLADYLAKSLSGQFVVENRPGAGQMIGIEAVARGAPDGYTLLMAASTLAINPVMYKNVKYDALRDFEPITQVAALPNVLIVHPSFPAHSLADFIALARQKPGAFTYASAGVGTSPQMAMELLKSMAGIDLQHIPFRGTTPGVTEVLGGRVTAMFANLLTAKPLVEAGQLRALAVSGLKRAESMPGIPTVAEGGVPNYEALQWYGLLAPAGTPGNIVTRLQAEVTQALKTPEVKERLAADGAEPVGSTAAEFAALIKTEIEKWANVARAANIRPE